MKLPIDTAQMTFMCASEPAAVLDFETKQPKADEHGQPLYSTQVVMLSEGGAEVISLKTPGRPTTATGQMLMVGSLVATPWAMGDRNGVAYRAAHIEPAAGASPRTKA